MIKSLITLISVASAAREGKVDFTPGANPSIGGTAIPKKVQDWD